LLSWWPSHLSSSHHVDMKMIHWLTSIYSMFNKLHPTNIWYNLIWPYKWTLDQPMKSELTKSCNQLLLKEKPERIRKQTNCLNKFNIIIKYFCYIAMIQKDIIWVFNLLLHVDIRQTFEVNQCIIFMSTWWEDDKWDGHQDNMEIILL
jgi:hypothetical protein